MDELVAGLNGMVLALQQPVAGSCDPFRHILSREVFKGSSSQRSELVHQIRTLA